MATVKIDPTSLSEMKAFYQGELQTTLSRLQHIQSILEQLGDSGVTIEINATGAARTKSTATRPIKASTSARKKKGKPGPKSKWDKMILGILKSEDRPMTYDELTDALLKASGKPSSETKRTKATVQNTIFKLRGANKVGTFSKGSREKHIGLAEWFSADGSVDSKYSSKVPSPKKAAPKKKSTGKRGRPAGSKNKKKASAASAAPARRRGRPRKIATESVTKPAVKKPAAKKATRKKAAPKMAAPKKVAAKKPVKAKRAPKAKKETAAPAASAATAAATPTEKPAAKKRASKPSTKKVAKKKVPAKKAAPAKKTKARKTPARGLSQAKAVQLPGDKTE